ncbi:MAG: purine-nucleoside phosphorylase [Candidatus Cloacimonetes bacterium]|nr:purine-nucleoside phosphorylase [Candidatus Cloacimonadota bacterium]
MQSESIKTRVSEAVRSIQQRVSNQPVAGIILGSGLAHLAGKIENPVVVSYDDIPHFPQSTVETHHGRLIFGMLGGVFVVAMQGRFHAYEGYSGDKITFGVRVMKELGIKSLIVSNACGGLNPGFVAGELVCITDHINLLGMNPLRGHNEESWGPRFVDMKECYDPALRSMAHKTALELGIRLASGVYVAVAGPNLETRAEYRMLSRMGADMVGMSTVPEVIVARHMDLPVLAFSVVTDMCLPDNLHVATFDDIIAVANATEPHLTRLITSLLPRIASL